MIVAYIDAYKRDFGVEPICRVLRDHDLPIAPSTYYVVKQRSRCARSLSDERLLPIVKFVHAIGDLVQRDWFRDAPDVVWVADFERHEAP